VDVEELTVVAPTGKKSDMSGHTKVSLKAWNDVALSVAGKTGESDQIEVVMHLNNHGLGFNAGQNDMRTSFDLSWGDSKFGMIGVRSSDSESAMLSGNGTYGGSGPLHW
jgi:hypothetical protein